jgi:hypothetical protein
MVHVAEHCGHGAGRGRHPWESFDRAWDMSLSCGASRRRGSGCRAYCAPRLMRQGAEGATDDGLAPVKSRTAFESCGPRPQRVLRRSKYKDLVVQWRCSVRHVRIARRRSAQRRE